MAVDLPSLNTEQLAFVGHVQSVALDHRRWRGPRETLRELVAESLGKKTDPEFVSFNDGRLQSELMRRDIAMWMGSDREFRLIDLRLPGSIEAAVMHAEHAAGENVCRFCLIAEYTTPLELEQELDHRRHPVYGSKIHPHCRRAWRGVRQLALQDADYAKRNLWQP